ncbi:hypothetical protein D3C76_1833870 [compost metagenome]
MIKNGKEENIEFDYGFVCLGMKPERPGLEDLQQHFLEKGVEILNLGDSLATRKIIDGVREGRNITITLERIGAL